MYELSTFSNFFEIKNISPFLVVLSSVLLISKVPTFSFKKIVVQRKMTLQQIVTNLQFMGMDGTNHIDTLNPDTEEYSYVLMLSDDHVSGEEGGEFINETVGQTVPYRYGRTIEFKTSDNHRGLAFKTPHVARYSVKFVGQVIEWH